MPQDNLKRLSPGVYRNDQGKVVYSTTGKNPTAAPGGQGKPKGQKKPMGPGKVSQMATGQAGQLLTNQNFGQGVIVDADERTIGADMGTTQEMADRAFAKLDEDITNRESREREQLIQTMANRGINVNDPNDPTYKRFMDDFDRKFRAERESAQQQAFEQGLSGQVNLGNLQEQIIGNQFGNTLKLNEANIGNLLKLLEAGFQAKAPGFKQQELKIANKAASKPSGGGGGGGNSPFKNTTMPGT